MVFSSIVFLYIFLPIMLLIYFIVPNKFKNAVMIVASLIFFCMGRDKIYFYNATISSNGLCLWAKN